MEKSWKEVEMGIYYLQWKQTSWWRFKRRWELSKKFTELHEIVNPITKPKTPDRMDKENFIIEYLKILALGLMLLLFAITVSCFITWSTDPIIEVYNDFLQRQVLFRSIFIVWLIIIFFLTIYKDTLTPK